VSAKTTDSASVEVLIKEGLSELSSNG
jgi:hypothetical protein